MQTVARLSADERYELFRNTADRMGLHDAIVEKIFWVCYTLNYLLHAILGRKTSFRIQELSEDYRKMKDMLYGEIPDFKDILNQLTQLENEINSLKPLNSEER